MEQIFSRAYLEEKKYDFFLEKSRPIVEHHNQQLALSYTKSYLDEHAELIWVPDESISLKEILRRPFETKTKYLFVLSSVQKTFKEHTEIIVHAATLVLPIFENKFPEIDCFRKLLRACAQYQKDDSKTVRKAIIQLQSECYETLRRRTEYEMNSGNILTNFSDHLYPNCFSDAGWATYFASCVVYPYMDEHRDECSFSAKDAAARAVDNTFKSAYVDLEIQQQLLDFIRRFAQ